jgi:hypothetical protein
MMTRTTLDSIVTAAKYVPKLKMRLQMGAWLFNY